MASALIISLFHSLWQSAILCMAYLVHQRILSNQTPDHRKSGWLLILLAQTIISIFTFIICEQHPDLSWVSLSAIIGNTALPVNRLMGDHSGLLLILYLLILILKSIRTANAWLHFSALIKKSKSKTDAGIRLFVSRKSLELGIRRKVSIFFSASVDAPVTFGFLKPVILLPLALVSQLSMEEMETLILHELNHIRKNDYLINWFLIAAEHLYFFNPFIHYACREIKWEREVSSDLTVLQFRYPVCLYAGSLYKAAAHQKKSFQFPMHLINKREALLDRIRYFSCAEKLTFRKNSMNTAILLPSVLLVLILSVSSSLLPELSGGKFVSSGNAKETRLALQSPVNTAPAPLMVPYKKESPAAMKNKSVKLPLPKTIQTQQDLALQPDRELRGDVMAVKLNESTALTKQIIIKEEDAASGETITKSYQLSYVEGRWMSTLLWIIKEKASEQESQ